MSSYGEELEICCWTSPFDLIAPYDPSSLFLPESPFPTEECAAHWDDPFCSADPIDFFHPHRDPALLLPERPSLIMRTDHRSSFSLPTQSTSCPPSPRPAVSPSPSSGMLVQQQQQMYEEPKSAQHKLINFFAERPSPETSPSSPAQFPAHLPASPIPNIAGTHCNIPCSVPLAQPGAPQTTFPVLPPLSTQYLHSNNMNSHNNSGHTSIMEEEEEIAESITDSECVDSPRKHLPTNTLPGKVPTVVIEEVKDEEEVKVRLANEETKIDLDTFKLSSSKSPVIEAFVFCALQHWGVKLKNVDSNGIQFEVTDFDYFYERSNRICSKQRPTEDPSARIKGLRRWFPDFPSRRSQISGPFTVSVSGKGKEKAQMMKIKAILDKSSTLVGISKIRKSR